MVSRATDDKSTVPIASTVQRVHEVLTMAQTQPFEQASNFRDDHVHPATTIDEAAEAARDGAARIPWAAVGPAGEHTLAEAGAIVRGLRRQDDGLLDNPDEPGVEAIIARAY